MFTQAFHDFIAKHGFNTFNDLFRDVSDLSSTLKEIASTDKTSKNIAIDAVIAILKEQKDPQ